MTFSPLTAEVAATSKYSSRGGNRISRLIIHHTATTSNDSVINEMARNQARDASVNYVLKTDGTLVGVVPEEYRAWTSGSYEADAPAITVETVNTTGGPSWRVSDAQLETLARLAVDLSTRYGWGALTRANVRGHREFYPTSCPGPYLYPRLDDRIVPRANEIRNSGGGPALAVITDEDDDMSWNEDFVRPDGIRTTPANAVVYTDMRTEAIEQAVARMEATLAKVATEAEWLPKNFAALVELVRANPAATAEEIADKMGVSL